MRPCQEKLNDDSGPDEARSLVKVILYNILVDSLVILYNRLVILYDISDSRASRPVAAVAIAESNGQFSKARSGKGGPAPGRC